MHAKHLKPILESLGAVEHGVNGLATLTRYHVPAKKLGSHYDHFLTVIQYADGSFSTSLNDGMLTPEQAVDALCDMARAADAHSEVA